MLERRQIELTPEVTLAQLVFWGEPENIPIQEYIPVGTSSAEVFVEILSRNRDIKKIYYSTFDPNDSSAIPTEQMQRVRNLDVNEVTKDSLLQLSDGIVASTKEVAGVDPEIILRQQALAVSSKVALVNGDTGHIPMFDFVVLKSELGFERIMQLLSNTRGVILSTDRSYHFMGFEILDTKEWEDLMRKYQEQELLRTDGPLFDLGYLTDSLIRGFAALRLFGYPGTKKEEDPKVVRVI